MELYGTLGPACAREDTLTQMLELGMTGLRLNLSHVTLAGAAPWLEALEKAAARTGIRPALLIDMQGPEMRTGALKSPLPLREGERVALGPEGVPLPACVLTRLRPGQPLLLDDGKLLLRAAGGGQAQVLRGGLLQSRKSVALPGMDVRLPAVADTDRENLRLAAAAGVTGVMQPFVRGPEDLTAVRAALAEAGCGQARLFAKIEDLGGMEKLPALLPAADEIVIARGDLGNAMPLWELPAAQKRIAAACRTAGKPFMVVTQMLASMEQAPVPTRAEVGDIFNAVLDGASSLMVTGETAAGSHPVEVIRYLANTARAAESYLQNG